MSIASIGIKGLKDRKACRGGKPGKLGLGKMMGITQAMPAAAPVEQIVAGIDIVCAETCQFPGLEAPQQSLTAEELPFGMDEAPARAEQGMYSFQQFQASVPTWNVMQDGKGSDQVELCREGRRDGSLPTRGDQVRLDERLVRRSLSAASSLKQRMTEIHAKIGTAVRPAGKRPCQFAIAATQVEDGHFPIQRVDDAQDTRLEPLAGGGELLPEGLVELFIQGKQPGNRSFLHIPHYSASMTKKIHWNELRSLPPEKMNQARKALEEIRSGKNVEAALRDNLWNAAPLHKSALVATYRRLVEAGVWQADEDLLKAIRLKPMRTLSGVTTVTVLTKPYPCPGRCIFCPDEVRMPKSYLSDEPGAMRAVEHDFDPYAQVASRLEALRAVGHPTDKIELLILGGTFTSYPREYQSWFVKRCFEAMNAPEVERPTLEEDQQVNETAAHRNVGLSIETRPDEITVEELQWLRSLGVTKVQMGAQSMDDSILERNQRGHTVAQLQHAVNLLRAGGFKIVLHWMPNLLGATLASDRVDFPRLWQGPCPDEIKIYPTQLLETAPLYHIWQTGEYQPYTTAELVNLIADIKPGIPRYCRVNRIIRDIPSTHVVAGNKRTSLRQDVHRELQQRGTHCDCIRCREVRGELVEMETLKMDDLVYPAGGAEEHFLSFVTPEDKIAGFLRLSLPGAGALHTGMADLEQAAIIREVHVYGQSLGMGKEKRGTPQHSGLGTRLMLEAERIAAQRGFRRMAVIAAVGTRQYYLERGFMRGEFYLVKDLAV